MSNDVAYKGVSAHRDTTGHDGLVAEKMSGRSYVRHKAIEKVTESGLEYPGNC
jgi:hypothetical protein